MTTQQLDILTEEVMTVLTGYFNLVNAVQPGEGLQKTRFIHGIIEYMLTVEVKTAIFMRERFRRFNRIMINKISNLRNCVLVQDNENLMKALDELELYFHDSAVARGGRGVRRLRQTGLHSGIMTKRSNLSKQESINYLNHYYLNYCNCTNSILGQQAQQHQYILRRSERLSLKRKREE